MALTGLFSGEAAGDVERFKLGARSYLSSTTSHPYSRTEANMALSLIAVAQDDRSAAKTQYSEMEPWRHTVQDHSNTSIDRLLGLLARTIGEVDTSASHFEDALAFCRTAEYRPQLAWSLHDYSDMLLERNEPGDSEKAVSMLDEALQISTDLGMRPLMERVLSKRDILKA